MSAAMPALACRAQQHARQPIVLVAVPLLGCAHLSGAAHRESLCVGLQPRQCTRSTLLRADSHGHRWTHAQALPFARSRAAADLSRAAWTACDQVVASACHLAIVENIKNRSGDLWRAVQTWHRCHADKSRDGSFLRSLSTISEYQDFKQASQHRASV